MSDPSTDTPDAPPNPAIETAPTPSLEPQASTSDLSAGALDTPEPPPEAASWSPLTQELVDALTLEKLDENLYRGKSVNFVGKRVFGGQVLGQALRAAGYTTDRLAHSMHGYFLKIGDITSPIIYQVERLRDGKSFSNRQVKAIQNGEVIFNALISFAEPEAGLEYTQAPPDAPTADSLKNEDELKAMLAPFLPESVRANVMRKRHVEIRPINPSNPFTPKPEAPKRQHYFRLPDRLPDDPKLHQALIAFASDYALMGTGLMPHGISFMTPNLQAASLDHSIYFHHPARADDWLLYDMSAPITSHARGLNHGEMWQNGQLVVSTSQEGLMRLREVDAR